MVRNEEGKEKRQPTIPEPVTSRYLADPLASWAMATANSHQSNPPPPPPPSPPIHTKSWSSFETPTTLILLVFSPPVSNWTIGYSIKISRSIIFMFFMHKCSLTLQLRKLCSAKIWHLWIHWWMVISSTILARKTQMRSSHNHKVYSQEASHLPTFLLMQRGASCLY